MNVVAILHSRAVAFSTRHRLQDQSVADCVRHCAVHRRRDTLGSDRQRARRVRSTVLRGGQAGQAVDLLNQQDVTGLRVGQKPKQFRPSQLGAGLVLDVPGRHLQATLGGEGLQLILGAAGVLL